MSVAQGSFWGQTPELLRHRNARSGVRACVLTYSRILRLSSDRFLLPTPTCSHLHSALLFYAALLLWVLGFGVDRGLFSPVMRTVRVVTEPLPRAAPWGKLPIAVLTLHRAHRNANRIACTSVQNARKGVAAVVTFSFTDRSVRSSLPPQERSSDRIDSYARFAHHVLLTCHQLPDFQ